MKTVKPILSLILPLYNEAEHLEKSLPIIVSEIKRLGIPWEIIFVEDKSQDQTLNIIWGLLKKQRHMRLIRHNKNQGRGKSVRDGILSAKGEIIGFIDVDLEVSPIFIHEMLKPLLEKETDITIGKRIYNIGLKNFHRFILSRGYIYLVQKFLGLSFTDTEAGFKFFNRKKIFHVIKKCQNTGWFFDTEIIVRSHFSGLRVKEIPVLFIKNPAKKSTVSPLRDSLVYLWELFQFRRNLVRNRIKS